MKIQLTSLLSLSISLILMIELSARGQEDEIASLSLDMNEFRHYSETKNDSSLGSSLSTIRSKIRSELWTEYMTPFFQNIPHSTPESDNLTQYPPSYAVVWMDYDIGKDYKILYWQRSFLFPNSASGFQGFNAEVRNPRLAIRKINVIPISRLSSTYDLYVQLGFGAEADRGGRHFEFGFKTSHSYQVPRSSWSMGMTTELTHARSIFSDERGADLYGWIMPWANYQISSIFSTQHYLVFNFQHRREDPWKALSLDDPMPYIQNGIGINITDTLSATVLLNHNVLEPITLSTTWSSLWLNWTIL